MGLFKPRVRFIGSVKRVVTKQGVQQLDTTQHQQLRRQVSLLGRLLGEVIVASEGAVVFDAVEKIRKLSKATRAEEHASYQQLQNVLAQLDESHLLPVARAFSHFLTLANIAEQRHAVSRVMDEQFSATQELESVFELLSTSGIEAKDMQEHVAALNIDLVLTAHPTEIIRRTVIHKYDEISRCLDELELSGRTEREERLINKRLSELISQIWHSQDFRSQRPTPIDEARWGFAVIENSLWQAVPNFLRRLDSSLCAASGAGVPLGIAPVRFSSWMGGDRDGNPNVTASVSREALLLSRWQAADLYLKDVSELIDELSMSRCNSALRALAGESAEPYRVVLKSLRIKLRNTLRYLEQALDGKPAVMEGIVTDTNQLREPLLCCYHSLVNCGMHEIANSKLLDSLRRVDCFGVHLLRLDFRQEASVHTDLLSELTQHLGLGDYAQWAEAEKLAFLRSELANPRPLISDDWRPSDASYELLQTARLIAEQPAEAIGAYVISMASNASDVLAVELLLKACNCTQGIPVVPLFETLDDLENAASVVDALLGDAAYREKINHTLMIMIGYSDSAKDAGVMTAAWAQYRAQEELLAVCAKHPIALTLFHGRGGTIGRGGAPAHSALLSQPPGSLKSGLRVTEQGEMIRTKLGISSIATKTLALYASAILQANLLEPPEPKQEWRHAMDRLADRSCEHYRFWVQKNPEFVRYFRQATPEVELAKLRIGSRPARRRADNSISSLRAIPWIFAWSQNRLLLPAWLGAAQALAEFTAPAEQKLLKEMQQAWPFFATRLSMLEMVFAKSDANLSAHYDASLVDQPLLSIGEQLRKQLVLDTDTLLAIIDSHALLEDQSWAKTTIGLRNVYTDPLNVLQVEFIKRDRLAPDPVLDEAIMITIAGIAAGLRNTG